MAPKTQNHFLEFYKKVEYPIHGILYLILMTAIIYGNQIPDSIKAFGPNPIYRVFAFILVLAVSKYISVFHSMLLALLILLHISFTPGLEGYENSLMTARKQRRWFDEEVLGEKPMAYQNDKVITQAPNS